MKINTKLVSTFGAELIDKIIYPSSYENEIIFEDKMIKPHVARKVSKLGKIELNLLFKAITELNIVTALSNIENELNECVVQFKIDNSESYENLYYRCVIDSVSPTETIFYDSTLSRYVQQVFCTLIILEKYGPEVTENMNLTTSKIITVGGNVNTPCIVEITPTVNAADITVTGLTDTAFKIYSLTQNSKITIADGKITENSLNKFGSTENMWEFPRLIPGANNISVSRSTVNITIKYNPKWS